jgi:hypothetical protein
MNCDDDFMSKLSVTCLLLGLTIGAVVGFFIGYGFDMSHLVLQEQIDELRKKVNQIIDEGIAELKAQKLVDDGAHVRNEFIGSLDDAFSDAFYQDLSRWEELEAGHQDDVQHRGSTSFI